MSGHLTVFDKSKTVGSLTFRKLGENRTCFIFVQFQIVTYPTIFVRHEEFLVDLIVGFVSNWIRDEKPNSEQENLLQCVGGL